MSTHPRHRVRTLVVETPPNTPAATPQSTTWTLERGAVERMDVVIPSGHVGLTGVAFSWGGRQIIPYEGGEWITGNDDEVTVELDFDLSARALTVLTYNTDDTFGHSHHLRAYIVDLERVPEGLGVGGGFVPAPELGIPTELPGFFFDLDATEIAMLAAAGYDPEAAMPILEQILANTEQILLRLGALEEAPLEPLPPVEELPPSELEPLPAPAGVTRVPVPDVVGMTQSAATTALRTAGFRRTVQLVTERGREVVIAQQPRAGAQREPGFTVEITVRRNP